MKIIYSIIQKILEINIIEKKGTILMFHQVNDDKNTWLYEDISITLKNFKILLDSLLKKKQIKSIEKLEISSREDIYITFDDCFKEVYTEVYPYLKKNKIPFCIFVTTNYLDKKDYLTKDMLKELAQDELCTIGAHTVSHPLLRYSKKYKEELLNSKKELEKIINKKIYYFAYPYGSIYAVSKKSIKVAFQIYKFSFCTLKRSFTANDIEKRAFIPRININDKNFKKIIKG